MDNFPHSRSRIYARAASALVSIAVLLLAINPGFFPPVPGETPASTPTRGFTPWWNYSWAFRAPLTLDNTQNSAALSNYPVRMNLSLQSLI
ncbi:MAG: hypothetical protein QW761_02665, partial [Candidatus Aenigmatarchaeota archaeon]